MTLNLKKKNIQVYILSRNRPDYLRFAIESLLNQKHSPINFEIIISDSSDNDDVSKMINKDYEDKNIKYIRRSGITSHMGHTQLVVSELNSEYSVIFHDDDILHPDYIIDMSSYLNNNENVVAVGCNGMDFKNKISDLKNTSESKLRIYDLVSPIKFNNEKDFLERYLPGNYGCAALPCYMFRTKYLKEVMFKFPFRIGKPKEPSHADTLMLSSLLKYGSIVWIEKVLIYYRIHSSNLSVNESIPERLALLNYMKKKGVEKQSTNLILFRILFWIKWTLQQKNIFSKIINWRYRIIILSVLLKIIKISLRRDFWKIIFKRLIK